MIDSGQVPAEIKNRVLADLSFNPGTDAVLTLGPTFADPTLLALNENGMAGDIYFGTFDLGTEIVNGIKAGVINWGIDQQPRCNELVYCIRSIHDYRRWCLPADDCR